MRITNILVPLDGSALSELALPFAEAIASRAGARLTLIREAHPNGLVGDGSPLDQRRCIEESEDYLRSFAVKLAARGMSVDTGVPYGGSPAEWIVEEAGVRKADLIVMTTHDRVGPDRWLHGSVAEEVVHRASVPVMLVRDTFSNRFATEAPVLVAPLDGSALAESALPMTQALAHLTGAEIVLVGVGRELHRYLTSKAMGDAVLRDGDPAAEIAAVAVELKAAAIIMASHGRAGLTRALMGSVAGGVLHRSEVPVILVGPLAVPGVEQVIIETSNPALA